MTHWLVRAIPAVTLLVTALLVAAVGVILPYGEAANGGLASGQIRPGTVAFGAALIAVGAILAWLAWGVWRAGRRRTLMALAVSVAVFAGLAWVAVQPPRLIGSRPDPATNQQVPEYDTGGQRIAPAIVPYAIALASLVVAELRLRRRPA